MNRDRTMCVNKGSDYMKLSDAQKLLDTQKMMFRINGREEMAVAIDTVLQALEKTQTRIGTVENALLENSRLCYDEHRKNEILKMRNDRLQEMLLNSISKDKIREKAEFYYNEIGRQYDCDTATIKESQYIGAWNALNKLLKGE